VWIVREKWNGARERFNEFHRPFSIVSLHLLPSYIPNHSGLSSPTILHNKPSFVTFVRDPFPHTIVTPTNASFSHSPELSNPPDSQWYPNGNRTNYRSNIVLIAHTLLLSFLESLPNKSIQTFKLFQTM